MGIIIVTAVFAALLAFILGWALGFFQKIFAVPEDPLKGRVREALPGANCGACGFPGCDGYAGAVAAGQAGINSCTVGGAETAEKLSAIMGVQADMIAVTAVLACQGSLTHAPARGEYTGLRTCRGAKLAAGSTKLCTWGCLGFGDCAAVCQFDALRIGDDGLPKVDPVKCTGCTLCVAECPQQLLQAAPRNRQGAMARCSNHNPVKAMVLKTCKAGCIKCELCIKNCPEKCMVMENGIPAVDYTKCTSCGTCAAKCPTKVLTLLQPA